LRLLRLLNVSHEVEAWAAWGPYGVNSLDEPQSDAIRTQKNPGAINKQKYNLKHQHDSTGLLENDEEIYKTILRIA